MLRGIGRKLTPLRGELPSMPLQAVPTDPAVLEKLAAFTEKYGYEFASAP